MAEPELGDGPRLLVVDDRPAPPASIRRLARCPQTTVAASLEGVLAALRDAPPEVAFIHQDFDALRGAGAAVVVAAEIHRRCPGVPVVLYGTRSPADDLAVLGRMGATARFAPEATTAGDLLSIAAALDEEAGARRQFAATVASLAPHGAPRFERALLVGFCEEVERGMLRAALEQSGTGPGAAPSLGIREGRFLRRCRALGIPIRDRPPPALRSHRDRILVIGALEAAREIAGALADPPCGVVCLEPGALHASAEARAGAVAAIVHVAGVASTIDAWALRRVAPFVPLLLHGEPCGGVVSVLRALGVTTEPVPSDAVAGSRGLGTLLLSLGRACSAADRACVRAGGLGLTGGVPADVSLDAVLDAVAHSLAVGTVAETGSQRRAAKRLGISLGALNKRLRRA